jgi:hypothetical protein
MPERFTETLRAASEPSWSQAVGHRFVNELFTGAVRGREPGRLGHAALRTAAPRRAHRGDSR